MTGRRRFLQHLATAGLLASALHAGAQGGLPRRTWNGAALLQRTNFAQDFERLVIKFQQGTGVRARAGRLRIDPAHGPPTGSAAHQALQLELRRIERLLRERGLVPRPLFAQGEGALDAWRQSVAAASGKTPIDLNLYVAAELPARGHGLPLASLSWSIVGSAAVEVVYPETLTAFPGEDWIGPDDIIAPGATANYMGLQGYLKPAPDGIDAFYAWTVPGGTGAGIRVHDVDTGVNASHEDLPALFSSDGAGYDPAHGTAVLGVIAARNNGIGLKGIAYGAQVGMVQASNLNMASRIQEAAMELQSGDVLLIETGKTLAGWDCECNPTQAGTVAQEYYAAQFDAIQTATLAGITVVQVGGNGCVDYDDASFDGSFDLDVQDSGAILVGAGLAAARQPTCYSPYGSRIDLHAWAEQIVCLEFVRPAEEPVFDGGPNRLYGPNFGGTSGAGAIVAGAVASLQGVVKAATGAPLSPAEVRDVLKSTGTPQTGDLERPIGPMPDLQAAILEIDP